MRLQARFKTLENDCFNLLIVDPNPPLDLIHFSLFLRLENTGFAVFAVVLIDSKRHRASRLAGIVVPGICHGEPH